MAGISNDFEQINGLSNDIINNFWHHITAFTTSNQSFTYSQLLQSNHEQFLRIQKINSMIMKVATVDTHVTQQLTYWLKDDYGYLVIQAKMIPRWHPQQAQSLSLCTRWAADLGLRLFGHLCSSCNLGQHLSASNCCKGPWSPIRKHKFCTHFPASRFGCTSLYGTACWHQSS